MFKNQYNLLLFIFFVCKNDMSHHDVRTLLFPGQGSQYVGMGKDLIADFPSIKKRFEEADDFFAPTGKRLTEVMFEGPESVLMQTEWAQPALFTLSAALMDVLWERIDRDYVKYVAGHSLGEYSALYAAQCFSFQEGLELIQARCNAMATVGQGGMMAVLKLSFDDVEALIAHHGNGLIEVANDNCPGQVVISGDKNALDALIPHAQALGARCIPLKVSGPFHTSLMQPAALLFLPHLDRISMLPPRVPVLTNVSAHPQQDAATLKAHLGKQLTGRVRWRETLYTLQNLSVTQYLEIGAGTVLAGLLNKTFPDATISSLGTLNTLSAWLSIQPQNCEVMRCST